jgi:TPP-dependent pyruvate/acetoin dehydrogenase alpha subunit
MQELTPCTVGPDAGAGAFHPAQLAHARAVSFLAVCNKKTGRFIRVAESADREKLRRDEEIIEVWEKDPNVRAFSELLNRAYGRPREQKQEVDQTITYKWGDE